MAIPGISPTTGAGYARLKAQLTAAADSIKDTIAEGCGAATNKEFARFLDMSIKSANETEGHLLTTRDLELFSEDGLHVSKESRRDTGQGMTMFVTLLVSQFIVSSPATVSRS